MPEDVQDVLSMMKQGNWDIASMIIDEFRLEQLPQAVTRAADVNHALNVVIKYGKTQSEQ